MEFIEWQEISKNRISKGTSNPWATSSTSKYELVIWSEYGEDFMIEDEFKRRNKHHPQAPISTSIDKIEKRKIEDKLLSPSTKNMKEYVITYSTTVWYN